MKTIGFLIAAMMTLTLASGCSRTSDGSVQMPEPYLAQSFVPGVKVLTWRRQRLEPPPEATQFPSPPDELVPQVRETRPAIVRRVKPQRRKVVQSEASQTQSGSGADVVCHDVTNAKGRVRVVCD